MYFEVKMVFELSGSGWGHNIKGIFRKYHGESVPISSGYGLESVMWSCVGGTV
jgi:hypothetical protein